VLAGSQLHFPVLAIKVQIWPGLSQGPAHVGAKLSSHGGGSHSQCAAPELSGVQRSGKLKQSPMQVG
jgi:hypothetical protein